MKKLFPLWFILIVIFILGFVYRNKITHRLTRFKMVHAPLGYSGPLQDPIEQHLKEATCWNASQAHLFRLMNSLSSQCNQ